jgi:hypothetical protein
MRDNLLIQKLMMQMSWITEVDQIIVAACQLSIKEIASLAPRAVKVGSTLKHQSSRRI